VDIHQADARQFRGSPDGTGYGVGDIVEFEVEEDTEAEAREPFDGSRTFRSEELAADLDHAGDTTKLTRQGAGWPQAVNIQGND
jgi:hypothetical protein